MRIAGKILLWILTALLLALAGVFAWRTAAYFHAIKRGKTIDLGRYAAEFTQARGLPASSPSTTASIAQILGGPEDPLLGKPDALLTIVEFGDFDCPFCRKAFPVIRQIAAEYGDRVRFVFRDFPVSEIHPRARAAHASAACAHEQGKFWQYHDKLYQNQERRGDADLRAFAAATGLDMGRFDQCAGTQKYAQEIDADFKDGIALGVQGTPTWFVVSGGAYEKVEGALPIEVWKQILNAILK